jgi:hypothetical protein
MREQRICPPVHENKTTNTQKKNKLCCPKKRAYKKINLAVLRKGLIKNIFFLKNTCTEKS